MKLKRWLSVILAITLSFSLCIPAFADDVNVDNILHGDSNREGRYKHTGNDWGWVVECYVATTDTGKLDISKTLTDNSNAAYLGRVIFTSSQQAGRFPALQRPVAIQTNGGGALPSLTGATPEPCLANGFPDPFTTGSTELQHQFQVASPPLENFWMLLGSGDIITSQKKAFNVVSDTIKDKVRAFGNSTCLNPGNPDCVVEYAFVITPIVFLMIDPSINSSCNWNEQFWMGANEGAVLNRYSLIAAQTDLQNFITRCAASGQVRTLTIPKLWRC